MTPVKRADPSDFTAADPGPTGAHALPFASSPPPASLAPMSVPPPVSSPRGLTSLGEQRATVVAAPAFVPMAPVAQPVPQPEPSRKPFKWGWNGEGAASASGAAEPPASARVERGQADGKGLSAAAASDLAADRERPRASVVSEPRATGVARRNLVELLHVQPGLGARLERERALAEAAGLGGVRRGAEGDVERQRVLRVLSCADPADGASARANADAALLDLDRLELPLVLLLGELRPVYDELETLRIMCVAAQPFALNDKRLAELIKVGQDLLGATLPPHRDAITGTVRQIEQSLPSASNTQRYVLQQVQRVLCEQRHYKKRNVFGASHIRVDLALPRAERPLAAYLDAGAAEKLPLLPTIPVVVLGELRPREDALEPQPEAFSILALGRKMDLG
jgi:hypothetical protein